MFKAIVRKSGIPVLMIMAVLFPLHANAQADIRKLDMYAGEVKVLNGISMKRVAIGSGTLLKVKQVPGKQLVVIAEKVGDTSLHIWQNNGKELHYKIHIAEQDPAVRVKMEDTIVMKVRIVEFLKSKLRDMGINWADTIDGPVGAFARDLSSNGLFRGTSENPIFNNLPLNVASNNAYFGIASEITSRINMMATAGDAVTIAEPTLSCRNGGKAKFLAGGEIPIPIQTNLGLQIEYKEYGIALEIEPVTNAQGTIAAKLMTEVSRIDNSVTVAGAPGLLSRRTETQMNVKEGETIVISGLVNSEQSDDVDKLPFLGNIPILGYLFKSERFQSKKTELVVFVTPTIRKVGSGLTEYQGKLNKRAEQRLKTINKRVNSKIVD